MQTTADKAKKSFFDGTTAYYLTDAGRKLLQLVTSEEVKALDAYGASKWTKHIFSDISFGMCWCLLMSWVQQVHNAAVAARSLGCQCDTEMP